MPAVIAFARRLPVGLLLAIFSACALPPPLPGQANGIYRLDYSGVYGTGRVDLQLAGGHVAGLGIGGPGPVFGGHYSWTPDRRLLRLQLRIHLPPLRQLVGDVAVVGAARQMMVAFDFSPDLDAGESWPVSLATQYGPIEGRFQRLE
ncbi:hypothetical protein [Dongia sp.]|uniref:hypothetical protein n=1 Tax=Dongia sp. TaxID=1977262 RepID=UPI0035B34772